MSDRWERELDEITGIAGAGWDVPDEVDGDFNVSATMPLSAARRLSLGNFMSKAPSGVVKRNRERSTKERLAQELDAFAFLTKNHDAYDGELNRDYDPMDVPEAALTNELDYVDTGIGALYGLGGEQHLWTLAGWNVKS